MIITLESSTNYSQIALKFGNLNIRHTMILFFGDVDLVLQISSPHTKPINMALLWTCVRIQFFVGHIHNELANIYNLRP